MIHVNVCIHIRSYGILWNSLIDRCFKYLWRTYSALFFAAVPLCLEESRSTTVAFVILNKLRTFFSRAPFIQTLATSLSVVPVSLKPASIARHKFHRHQARSQSGRQESSCLNNYVIVRAMRLYIDVLYFIKVKTSLTHFILRDELNNEAHIGERSFVRIVGNDSRHFR